MVEKKTNQNILHLNWSNVQTGIKSLFFTLNAFIINQKCKVMQNYGNFLNVLIQSPILDWNALETFQHILRMVPGTLVAVLQLQKYIY